MEHLEAARGTNKAPAAEAILSTNSLEASSLLAFHPEILDFFNSITLENSSDVFFIIMMGFTQGSQKTNTYNDGFQLHSIYNDGFQLHSIFGLIRDC